jgi:hypothetical protein
VRALVKSLLSTVALTFVVGCNGVGEIRVDATSDVPPEMRAALAARTVYPAKREEWRADITTDTDSTMVPLVFRASRTTVALLQGSPTRISQFELNRHGLLLSTRPARIDAELNADVPRNIEVPSDLFSATSSGNVDIMDSATSTLVRESIGGFVFRRTFPLLRGGSGRVCTMAPGTLVHVRVLGDLRTLEAFALTANAADDALTDRHRFVDTTTGRLRFGNGDSERCVLITAREVMVISNPAVQGTGAFNATPLRITALQPPGVAARRTIDDVSAGRVTPVDSVTLIQPYVVDAAIVDGGFVVLLGTTSDRRGRIIDYYNERGEYRQSAMLPFTASAMTANGPRFLVLHQDEAFRWWLSSWLTPMAAQGAEAPPAPPRIDIAPAKQLFAPPGS